jgi:hypothetical protein
VSTFGGAGRRTDVAHPASAHKQTAPKRPIRNVFPRSTARAG